MKIPGVDHAIVDVLIIDGDKFLIIQEGKAGREGLYNLPGGHVEPNETLFEAATREAREETGYEVELTGLIGVYQSVYSHLNVSGPLFSAKVIGGEATPTAEHPEVRWVTKDELHELARTGKFFTTYPPFAVDHYASRGAFPLDVVTAHKHD
jgi:8-oxo-dGTP pyrophosphatase MutT (NUDIX family)